jgi:Tfp pilus assembly protein PilV
MSNPAPQVTRRNFVLPLLLGALALVLVLGGIFVFSGTPAKVISNSQTAVVEQTAAAIARDAEGMADSSPSASGVVANANGFVRAAAQESSGASSVTAAGSSWTVTGTPPAAVSVCLHIAAGTNAAYSVKAGAC